MSEKELNPYQKKELRQEAEQTKSSSFFVPNVDIFETEKAVMLLAEMPGVSKDNVEIDLEDRTLTISGHMSEEQLKEEKCLLKEFEIGNFVRSFTISESIDQQAIQASMTEGILTVTLPKAEP